MTSYNRFAIIAILALLWTAFACASSAPTPTVLLTPTPTPAPVSLRIAYTSDSLGNIDPVIAVGCG